MKGHRRFLFFIVIAFFISIPGVYAKDWAKCPYEAQINKLISFYQGRLYLLDSEYKILAEIAQDAESKVAFLQAQKAELISEMKLKGVIPKPKKITGYIAAHTHYIPNTAEAYEQP
jgi:hypothetical protein